MVTAKLIAGQSIPLDLPKAATAGAMQTVFTLTIDDQGHVQANGRAVPDRIALRDQARQALHDDPALRTLISASARTSHGTVMQVVDSVREAGMTKIAFAADKAEPALQFGDTRP
jgi:biopolymer transport protein ExbD